MCYSLGSDELIKQTSDGDILSSSDVIKHVDGGVEILENNQKCNHQQAHSKRVNVYQLYSPKRVTPLGVDMFLACMITNFFSNSIL